MGKNPWKSYWLIKKQNKEEIMATRLLSNIHSLAAKKLKVKFAEILNMWEIKPIAYSFLLVFILLFYQNSSCIHRTEEYKKRG